ETCVGWCGALAGVSDRDHLPKAARDYLAKIEASVGAPIGMVGIGPERSATLL
ncbi:MAG: adenylosuccinate synthetase, partial [Chloroflexi bacterium]